MILSIGEALIESKNGKKYIGGCPLNVARAASNLDSPVSIICGISSDKYGRQILEYIIDNLILFDANFCGICDDTSNAAYYLDAQKLENAFNVNTDVNAVLFGSFSFLEKDNSKILLDFINRHSNLVSYFLACKDAEDTKKALKSSDIVQISKNNLINMNLDVKQFFDLCANNLIVTDENSICWYKKDRGFENHFEFKATVSSVDSFTGALLNWLDVNKKLCKPFIISDDEIVNALEFSINYAMDIPPVKEVE